MIFAMLLSVASFAPAIAPVVRFSPAAAPAPAARCAAPAAVALRPRLAQSVRRIWARCTDEVCAIGPAPIRWLQHGMVLVARPFKKRPLAKLGKNECSAGIYKVARVDGVRQWLLVPLPSTKDECSIEDSMEMF